MALGRGGLSVIYRRMNSKLSKRYKARPNKKNGKRKKTGGY